MQKVVKKKKKNFSAVILFASGIFFYFIFLIAFIIHLHLCVIYMDDCLQVIKCFPTAVVSVANGPAKVEMCLCQSGSCNF